MSFHHIYQLILKIDLCRRKNCRFIQVNEFCLNKKKEKKHVLINSFRETDALFAEYKVSPSQWLIKEKKNRAQHTSCSAVEQFVGFQVNLNILNISEAKQLQSGGRNVSPVITGSVPKCHMCRNSYDGKQVSQSRKSGMQTVVINTRMKLWIG